MTFLHLAEKILKIAGKPLSSDDIWKMAKENGLAQEVSAKGKTPWQTINAQLYMDIKNKGENSRFKQVSKRPACFGLSSLNYNTDRDHSSIRVTCEKKREKKKGFIEKDLHIILSTFLRSNAHFKCYSKTISEKKSSKRAKGHNEWLHPDMVGVYFPFEEYQDNTLALLETFKENPYKLFSFELKTTIHFSNLRESYFQTVSNSSWADEGYLAVLDIEDDPDLLNELRRLNNAFGIGVIRLNTVNIEQSEILFTASPREKLDWDTIDRLVEENPDFHEWIQHLMDDVKVGRVRGKYDSVLEESERFEYMSKRNIPFEDMEKST